MMKKTLGFLGIFFFIYMTVFAKSFLRPEHGLTFGEIKKINQEIQMLYQQSLKEYLLEYVQGRLKFTATSCQIRDPEIGCLSFHKHPSSWNLQVDFKTSKILKLQGFNMLKLVRHKGQNHSLRIYDSDGRVIQFPFKKGKIMTPIFPLGHTKINYEKVENIVSETDYIYNKYLKAAMRQYSGEQWTYPIPLCDKDLEKLGCVSYKKNDQTWLLLVKLNRRASDEFSGFNQIILRHRADGLGELELSDRRGRSLFFPIVNAQLKDLFIPMEISSSRQAPVDAQQVKLANRK
ncbi:MAG: hypothetical protein HQM13_08880 [SAR324 cluster bacterium]|nr:hypothetical protein [SAR324 cluster bacterium]